MVLRAIDLRKLARKRPAARGQPAGAMIQGADRVADSTGNWVDWLAPGWLRPYLRLARFDRPMGSWLLLIPCWGAAALPALSAGASVNAWDVACFFVGAFAILVA